VNGERGKKGKILIFIYLSREIRALVCVVSNRKFVKREMLPEKNSRLRSSSTNTSPIPAFFPLLQNTAAREKYNEW